MAGRHLLPSRSHPNRGVSLALMPDRPEKLVQCHPLCRAGNLRDWGDSHARCCRAEALRLVNGMLGYWDWSHVIERVGSVYYKGLLALLYIMCMRLFTRRIDIKGMV